MGKPNLGPELKQAFLDYYLRLKDQSVLLSPSSSTPTEISTIRSVPERGKSWFESATYWRMLQRRS